MAPRYLGRGPRAVQRIADFETVIADARAGDESAWRTLYRALSPQVMRYVRVHGVEDAPDVLGDVFIDLARALPRFHGDEGALVALLFHLVHIRLAEGDYRSSTVYMPLERVLDAASREVVGGDRARGSVISLRMRRRLRLLSTPGRQALALRVFGQLSEAESRDALAGAATTAAASPPLRFSRTGEAVLARASALVAALPPPPTAYLEARHVREAAESARFLASAGAPGPAAELPPAARPARSRTRRVVGPLLLGLLVTAAATGLLSDAVEAAGETVRRGLGQIEPPGSRRSCDARKGGGGHADGLVTAARSVAEMAAGLPPAAVVDAPPAPAVPAAEDPPATAAPARASSGSVPASPAPPVPAPPQSEPAPRPPDIPNQEPEEPDEAAEPKEPKVTYPEKPRVPDGRNDDREEHERPVEEPDD